MTGKRELALAAAGVVAMGLFAAPTIAETVFNNQPKTPVTSATVTVPTAPTSFSLREPSLITSIKTYSPGNAQPGVIRLYRRGYLLMRKRATRVDSAYCKTEPNLVYPAGMYVISQSSKTWSSAPTTAGQGVAVVEAQPLSAADKAQVDLYFQLTSCPISIADISKLDPNKLKQDISSQTLGMQNELTKRGALADLNNQQDARTGRNDGTQAGPGKGKPLSDFKNNAITPRSDRDTFGAHRIDDPRSHNPGDYGGNSRGNAMDGDDEDPAAGNTEAQDQKNDIEQMLREGGGTVSGDSQEDAEECAYMMSVGSDAWSQTKGMNQVERKAYWNDRARSTQTPREDNDTYGGFRIFGSPIMRERQRRFVNRAISGRRGQADGGVQQTGGGKAIPRVGKDDRPDKERGVGTVNWDTILKINQVINPGRT